MYLLVKTSIYIFIFDVELYFFFHMRLNNINYQRLYQELTREFNSLRYTINILNNNG